MTRWYTLTLREGAARDPAPLLKGLAAYAAIDPESARLYPELSLLSVRAPENSADKLARFRDAPHVYEAYSLGSSDDGLWYVNLIDAVDDVMRQASDASAPPFTVVNVSLQPPARDHRPFSPQEPFVQALRLASAQGIAFVLAAGNYGERGDGSMSNWARTPQVIAVAACDEAGAAALPFSGRGVEGQFGPLVSSQGTQQPNLSSAPGTSFAAPRVSDVVMFTGSFLGAALGPRAAALRVRFPEVAKNFLRAMAKPMPGVPRHVAGAGSVDYPSAFAFLRALTPARFADLAGVEAPETSLRAAAALCGDPARLVEASPASRCAIDVGFEWTRPAFVPGLVQIPRGFLYRGAVEEQTAGDLRIAHHRQGRSIFREVAILKGGSIRPPLVVGISDRAGYRAIADAVREAEPGDVVHIEPGVYAESVRMKSGVTLSGAGAAAQDVVIRPPAGEAVRIADCRSVALQRLTLQASSPRAAACHIVRSGDVVVSGCAVRSAAGNALLALKCDRVELSNTDFRGGINGSFIAFSRGVIARDCRFHGRQTGMYLLQASGLVASCDVRGEQAEGAFAIASRMPILGIETLEVYTYPIGLHYVPVKDVSPPAVAQPTLAGGIARELYLLRVTAGRFSGGRFGFAADDFHYVPLENASVEGAEGRLALIEKYEQVSPPSGSPEDLMSLIGRSLAKVALRPLP